MLYKTTQKSHTNTLRGELINSQWIIIPIPFSFFFQVFFSFSLIYKRRMDGKVVILFFSLDAGFRSKLQQLINNE
jgi:hypothetical protein